MAWIRTMPCPLKTGIISIGSFLKSFTTLSLGVISVMVYSLYYVVG
jgi:hypothetical protein